MNKIVIRVLSILFLVYPLLGFTAELYKIDHKHTYVLWHASHFGFSTQTGKLRANGTILYDQKTPENSKVDVKILIQDLATGLPEFDKHLQDKLFFNERQFPAATFKSDKIVMTDERNGHVKGTLTFLGVSKPVELIVQLNKIGKSPVNNKDTIGFTAKTEVKRSEFGMNSLIPGVSDDVAIDIQVEANKVAK